MLIDLNNSNYYIYKLVYKNTETVVQDAIEWMSNDNAFSRGKKFDGMFLNVSNTISFAGNTAKYLNNIVLNDNVNAKILFKVYEVNNDFEYDLIYENSLDLTTYKYSNEKFSCNMVNSGYENLINVNGSKKINLSLVKDFNKKELEDIKFDKINIKGRELEYKNYATEDKKDITVNADTSGLYKLIASSYLNSCTGVNNPNICGVTAFLTNKIAAPDEQFHSQIEARNFPTTGNMFYINDFNYDIDLNIDLILELSAKLTRDSYAYNPSRNYDISINLAICEYDFANNQNYNIVQLIELDKISFTAANGSINYVDFNIKKIKKITLASKQSISIVIKAESNDSSGYTHAFFVEYKKLNSDFYVNGLHPAKLELNVITKSTYKETSHDCLLVKDVLYRLLNIIGIYNIKSDVLNNGYFKDFILINGFMLRKFPVDNKNFKNIEISIDNLIKSLSYIYPISIGIETIGLQDTLIIESKEYFYNNNVLELNSIFEVSEIMLDKSMYFNTIEIGYNKPNNDSLYDEKTGLDEYNTRIELSSPINVKASSLKMISKLRADSYGIEIVRRNGFKDGENSSSTYDNSIWIIDCKYDIVKNAYTPKLWQDAFDDKPKGISNPENAFNLSITPKNMLINNNKFLLASLFNIDDELIVINRNKNGNLSTIKNGVKLLENSNIEISNFFIKYKAVLKKINIEITKDIYKKLLNNKYSIIKIKDKSGNYEIGYLKEISANKNQIILISK